MSEAKACTHKSTPIHRLPDDGDLTDYFAGEALKALAGSCLWSKESMAERAYAIAEAMMAERERRKRDDD